MNRHERRKKAVLDRQAQRRQTAIDRAALGEAALGMVALGDASGFMMHGSERMQVIRPASPERVLQLVEKLTESQDTDAFAELPLKVGCDYTFVGWASKKEGKLLDDGGNIIGSVEGGDSLVTGYPAVIGDIVIHGTPEGAPS
jgi:hypothetical protein